MFKWRLAHLIPVSYASRSVNGPHQVFDYRRIHRGGGTGSGSTPHERMQQGYELVQIYLGMESRSTFPRAQPPTTIRKTKRLKFSGRGGGRRGRGSSWRAHPEHPSKFHNADFAID